MTTQQREAASTLSSCLHAIAGRFFHSYRTRGDVEIDQQASDLKHIMAAVTWIDKLLAELDCKDAEIKSLRILLAEYADAKGKE